MKLQGLKVRVDKCLPLTGDQFFSLQKDDAIWCVVQFYTLDKEEQSH